MTKTSIYDIMMLVLIYVLGCGMVFGFVVCCVFMACGLIAGIIVTAISAFITGIMFGIELINML